MKKKQKQKTKKLIDHFVTYMLDVFRKCLAPRTYTSIFESLPTVQALLCSTVSIFHSIVHFFVIIIFRRVDLLICSSITFGN